MRNRYRIALVSFVVALPLLMAPTGGIPSRPRFQAVTVYGQPSLTLAPTPTTGTAGINLTTGAGTAVVASPGTAAAVVGDAAAGDLVLRTTTKAIRFVVDGGTATAMQLSSGGVLSVGGVNVSLNGVEPAGGTAVGRIVSQQFKGGDTTRSSTITLADDVTLAGLAIPAAGTYLIDGRLCFFGVTTGTQGIRMRYEFTGSAGVGTIGSYTGFVNGAVVGGGNFLALDANFISFATLTIGGAGGDCVRFEHTLNATGSGTVSLQWAQNTSNANGTTLARGSVIVITRTG